MSTNSDGNIYNPAAARSIETIAVLGAGTMVLRRMVRDGKLGKKSGEGFYKWNEPEPAQRAYTKRAT